jgi:hypothetical protein
MEGSESGRRGWPLGMVGAFALIALVESFVGRHELDFTTPARMEWRLSGRAAVDRAPGSEVLGLGTSMTKMGLFPRVVERESGRRTYNLACCAGRMAGSYFLLRRAIEAGATPGAILLEVHPTYLATPFREGLSAWADLLDPRDCLDLAWDSGDATFFARTMLARILPSLNARAEIRSALLAAIRGEINPNRLATGPQVRNLDRNAGAFIYRRDTPYEGEIAPFLAEMYLKPGWSCDRLNERYLRRLLDLCVSKQIQVYWLIPPFVPQLQAIREQIGNDAAYTQFTKRLQADYPGMVVLDARHSGYQHRVFIDAAHLDYPGAVTFSAEIGRILKASLPPAIGDPSWVDLPAYRDRTTDTILEDVAQSAKALEQSSTVKR